jgi:outer membrane protein, multidrug efflux system
MVPKEFPMITLLSRPSFLTLVVLALTACASGSPYQRPDVSLPSQWQTLGGAAAPGAPTNGTWWGYFESAELNRLMEAAVDGNRDLKAANSRMAQARALTQIDGALQLPSVGVNTSAARSKRAGASVSNQFGAGLNATYELDLWGKNRQTHEAARSRLQSSSLARQALLVTLQADVAVTYFQLLSAQDRLAMAQTTLRNTEAVLRLLQVQHQAGAVSKLEVVRQQGLVASVKADMAPIERQRQQARDALAVLLGRHPQDMALSTASLNSLKLPVVDAGLPSALLSRRPDIAQAEAELVAANADVNAARAALFPSIKLTAAGGVESAALSMLLRPASVVHALAAGLAAPIFDGGRLRGQLAFNEAGREALVHAYHQAVLLGLREVEDGLSAVHRLAEQATHQAEVVTHAAEAQSMAELRFRNGAVDFATVLDAQRVLLAAQAAQATVTLARYAAVTDLYRSLGGSWAAASVTPSHRARS